MGEKIEKLTVSRTDTQTDGRADGRAALYSRDVSTTRKN